MLTFADDTWHVLTNLLVFFAGAMLAVLQKRFFSIGVGQALFFYVWHSAFCIYYYYYSLSNTADATLYYLSSLTYEQGFAFGTLGIYYITSLLTQTFSMSYGGSFLAYNLIGYMGMLALYAALTEIFASARGKQNFLPLCVALLPGLSFWSSAIGKDALSFMGASLAVWASLNLVRRFPAMAVALLAMMIVRPHIAAVLMASLGVALLISWRTTLSMKILLVVVAVPTAATAVFFAAQYLGLGDITNLSEVRTYIEDRQELNREGGSSIDITAMSPPARLFAFLFRPLFFDASGLLGLGLSFENLAILVLCIVALFNLIFGTRSRLNSFTWMFCFVFAVTTALLLANTISNLGLAARQKWMFMPMLLMLSLSYWGKSKSRGQGRVTGPIPQAYDPRKQLHPGGVGYPRHWS